MNLLLIQSQTPYPLSIFSHDHIFSHSGHIPQILYQFISPRKSLLESSEPLQLRLLHSCPSGMPLQHHLACTLSFVPMWDLLFPGSLVPSLSWLSHLFENILQELLQIGCVGGKSLENLTFQNFFILLAHLTDSLRREVFQAGKEAYFPASQVLVLLFKSPKLWVGRIMPHPKDARL